jgi:hypothetical protein
MRKIRSSGSVEGVMGNHDPYSDCSFERVALKETRRRRATPLDDRVADTLVSGAEVTRRRQRIYFA